MEGKQETERRKTTLPVYTDTVELLDPLREVYPNGTKEDWDYFLKKMGEFYKKHREASA